MNRGPSRATDNVHLPATHCSRQRVVDVTRRRDSHRVNPLTTFVRSLGTERATANARAVLEARAREDWLVQGLTLRLERSVPASDAVPGAAVTPVASAVA